MTDQCVHMAAAYPTLDGDDTCQTHRHEPQQVDEFATRLAVATEISKRMGSDDE